MRTCHLIFAEIVHLVDAHAVAHAQDLALCGLPRVGAAERGSFIAGFITFREVIDHLKPELRAPNRAHGVKRVIHRRGAQRPRGGQFFVGIADRKAFLIVFNDFGQGIARIDPVLPKAGHVHRRGVAFGFAFDHPLRQHKAHAAPLAKTRHHTAGRPIVFHTRNRADKRVAIRGKGKGSVDHRFDTCRFQDREAFVSKFNAFIDFVKVIRKQLMPEIPRCAIHRPRFTGLFIKADAKPAPFLAQITFARRIHHMRMLFFAIVNLGNVICDDILVLHRM